MRPLTLPEDVAALLRAVGLRAAERGQRAFAVGGFVRDLLLDRHDYVLDLDVAVEGDALELASDLAGNLRADLVSHPRFGTATLSIPGGYQLDLAICRTETYSRPGALPEVRPSTLIADLFRRDFTVNALAVDLGSQAFGSLVDPYGGVADLSGRSLRVLHDRSFWDDPTRILRGLRLSARLGFCLEARTEGLMFAALAEDVFSSVSRERLRDEALLALRESHCLEVVRRFAESGALRRIHPRLELRASVLRLLTRLEPRDYLRGMLCHATLRESQALATEFRMPVPSSAPGTLAQRLKGSTAGDARLSRTVRLLRSTPEDDLRVLVALTPPGSPRRHRLLAAVRLLSVRSLLNGDDCIARGMRPGPEFRKLLSEAFDRQIDEGWTDRETALRWLAER